jgi:hypothetical protein
LSIPRSVYLSFRPTTNNWILHLPSSTLKKMAKRTSTIRLGSARAPIKVSLSPQPPLSGSIFTRVKLNAAEGMLTAGPVLGILTVSGGAGFRGNKKNFIDIIRTARRLGALVYVFTINNINWNNSTTRAYLYQEGANRWIPVDEFPLPDVVYNRIPTRQDEKTAEAQQTIQRLRAIPSVKLFNRTFFNKWDLYNTLEKDPRVAKYIPATKKLSTFEEFNSMLRSYPMLYLKPISGKAGQGIMSIESGNGSYILKKTLNGKLHTRSFRKSIPLWQHIKASAKRSYVIQQGIRLSTYQNRPFDIRVLVQKNEAGTWQISGIGIRVAGKNSITTHVPRGGSIARPEEVLQSIYSSDQYNSFITRLREAVIAIASALESSYDHLGELSMDIGLNPEGKIWFFEANAKPMKFDEPHIRKTSLERIIQYSQHLSKFSMKGEIKSAGQTNNS